MSQNEQQNFVKIKFWNLFQKRFKNPVTGASYWSDIMEFCRFTGKKFEKTGKDDVARYFVTMKEKTSAGRLSPLTLTKKFRELHSFAQFLIKENVCSEDFFYPYLREMKKESPLARSIPVEDMDALFEAASDDKMCYAILTLMYRAGLSSTEITELKGRENFVRKGEEIWALLPNRKEPCYVPDDAWKILEEYMGEREDRPDLFYNRRGRKLNTMYISRMMKKYCQRAKIPSYSAESVRNSCAFNLFAYGAAEEQTAAQMGRTKQQIGRYRSAGYRENLKKQANSLVKVRIEKP